MNHLKDYWGWFELIEDFREDEVNFNRFVNDYTDRKIALHNA